MQHQNARTYCFSKPAFSFADLAFLPLRAITLCRISDPVHIGEISLIMSPALGKRRVIMRLLMETALALFDGLLMTRVSEAEFSGCEGVSDRRRFGRTVYAGKTRY